MPIATLARRRLALAAGGLVLPLPALAQMRAATPAQTRGPFYPVAFPPDTDADLVRVRGAAAEAMGIVAHLRGRITDTAGEPIPGALVEIWQCDANGRYNHPRAPETRLFDGNFQGYGRVVADARGAYAFRTLRPAPYPGRTPHIHVQVTRPGGAVLVTQFYVAGEPLNARDGVLNGIRDPRARESVIISFVPADRIEPRALLAEADIVLRP
ncbi:dioxygenase family protein [Neoroseomonas soli]|uniref:Intradiol ring-cleavage dioxygenase n=1 Tax=Neoroseomonas soli TaxID=1081025 RepID=A0A9X9WRF0_9PROT|nr:protocatechuate 3,4-dioxygenase [Neoroseomonas soli]MBR0669729.1 intradiol ring-cleavage dioxygenase [Neoroseomonas soli]